MLIVDRFINYLASEKQYSKLTVRAYRDDICQFLLYIGVSVEEFELKSISSTELRSFVMSLSEKGLKHSSINRKISTLKSLFGYGKRLGLITVDPTSRLSLLKKERTLPAFVPLSRIENSQADLLAIGDDYLSERNSLIILLFYATGIRVAELESLKVEDLSFETMEIRVTGKGNKQRIVPIHHVLKKKLQNYIFLRSKILQFENKSLILSKKGSDISRSDIYRVVNRQLEVMGVQGKRSPHVLRHTFATHLLNNGAGIETVKELLGHANLSATQIYTHNNIGILVDKYKKAHPRAKEK